MEPGRIDMFTGASDYKLNKRQLNRRMVLDAVVLGGGVTGLTSALQLARAGYAVQIWTDKRGQACPNWVWQYPPYNVAGVASTGSDHYRNPDPQMVEDAQRRAMRWARESYPELVRLSQEEPAAEVHMVPVFMLARYKKLPVNPGRDWLVGYKLGPEALDAAREHTPIQYADAELYVAPSCHGPSYMRWLTAEFTKLGGEVVQKRVDSIAHCVANIPCRVLVNCSGIGARELVPDDNCYPCRGTPCTLDLVECY